MKYGDFAYIYDRLICDDIDYDKWCDYLENLFHEYNCAPERICELACGTGNMTSRLAVRGYDMTGVDISSDMLTVAADKSPHSRFICSDMSRFETDTEYDAVLCMIDGINYQITPKSVLRTFKNVRKSLTRGGVFIFDISTAYKLGTVIGNDTFIHSDSDIFYSWQNEYIEKYNLSYMLLNFFVREGNKYRRFEEQHIQRGWSERHLRYMLKSAGFSETTVYDELTAHTPTPESQRIVFVCK